MTRQAWFPAANRTAQSYAASRPRPAQSTINTLVLHTTEGGGWPSYAGGSMAPNLTLNCTSGRPVWRQHWPLPCASMALRQPSGGPSTNRMNVCQVELVGTGGWASPANRRRPYTVSGPHTQWYRPDAMMVRAVADLIAWLHREWGLPIKAHYGFGDWTGNHNHRMTASEWTRFSGVCGHQHVWGNDHTDPGSFPIAECLRIAAGGKAGGSSKVARPAQKHNETDQLFENEEDSEMMKGCWYYTVPGDKKTRTYLLFNEVSGFYHEISNGKGRGPLSSSYTNAIAGSWKTGSWPQVSKGHADAIKWACNAVRQGR